VYRQGRSIQEISGTYLSQNKHIIIGRGHPCVQNIYSFEQHAWFLKNGLTTCLHFLNMASLL
jgi:hypothetical protein